MMKCAIAANALLLTRIDTGVETWMRALRPSTAPLRYAQGRAQDEGPFFMPFSFDAVS
jgi:hypothetical protein